MINQKDYYAKRNRKTGKNLYYREKISLKFIKKIFKPKNKLLDLGCGEGIFLNALRRNIPSLIVKGIDFSNSNVIKVRKNHLEVKKSDLSKGICYKKEEFDMVYAGEVIEHLYNPDFFLQESNRILKKGGYLIISTPNLCAWFNRIVFPFGIQPIFMESSVESKFIGSGILRGLKKDPIPVGHVRVFNLTAIKDLLKSKNFEILEEKGAVFDACFAKPLLLIDKLFTLFPSLSSQIVILARKK